MNIFRIIYVIIATIILINLVTVSFTKKPRLEAFYYFTDQVILLSILYMLFDIDSNIIHFSIMLYLSIIFILFNFVILPYGKVINTTLKDIGLTVLDNFLIHILVPSLFIIYWFIYGTNINYTDLGYVLIYPLIYALFAIIRGKYGKPLSQNPTNYIYPFFDIEKFGVLKVILMILGLVIFVLLLGSLFIYLKGMYNLLYK